MEDRKQGAMGMTLKSEDMIGYPDMDLRNIGKKI